MGGEKAGTEQYAFGTQRERGDQPAPVGDAAGGDHRRGLPAGRRGLLNGIHGGGDERGAEAPGVRQQSTDQGLGIDGAVLGSEEGPDAFRGRAGPALVHVAGLEPVAAQAGLPLQGDVLPQLVHLGFLEGDRGDPASPEPDVDPGGIFQGGREGLVIVARPDAEAEQQLIRGLDLRGQHAGGGGRRGGGIGARLEDGDVEPAPGGGAGAGGADHAAADDGDVSGRNRTHRAAVRFGNRNWLLRRQPCCAVSSASRCSRSSPGSV